MLAKRCVHKRLKLGSLNAYVLVDFNNNSATIALCLFIKQVWPDHFMSAQMKLRFMDFIWFGQSFVANFFSLPDSLGEKLTDFSDFNNSEWLKERAAEMYADCTQLLTLPFKY